MGGAILTGGIKENHTATFNSSEGTWTIAMTFPSSLEPRDGVPLYCTCIVPGSLENAMSKACLAALAHLLLRGPYQVTLQDGHWRCSVMHIRLQAALGKAPADPDSEVVVPTPRSQGNRGAADVSAAAPKYPLPGSRHEKDVLTVLHTAVDRYGVAFPRRLQKWLWMSLRELLPPRTLKQFLR